MAQKSSPLPYKAWQEFEKNNHAPIFVIAYPNKVEAADPALRTSRLVEPLHKLMGPNTLIIDAGADPRWIEVKYRDNIHPTPEGTALLAKIISESLAKN
jgi:lysophospholipase L1-like esterase